MFCGETPAGATAVKLLGLDEPMAYWTYLALCGDDTIYTGATTNLARRIREHNKTGRGAKYTTGRLPVTLAQAWEVSSWGDALRLEIALKKCTRLEKKQLIEQPDKIHQVASRYRLDFVIRVSNKL